MKTRSTAAALALALCLFPPAAALAADPAATAGSWFSGVLLLAPIVSLFGIVLGIAWVAKGKHLTAAKFTLLVSLLLLVGSSLVMMHRQAPSSDPVKDAVGTATGSGSEKKP